MTWVSLVSVPWRRSPVSGSIGSMPEQKMSPPARIAGDWWWP
jgi:hypothetical protein